MWQQTQTVNWDAACFLSPQPYVDDMGHPHAVHWVQHYVMQMALTVVRPEKLTTNRHMQKLLMQRQHIQSHCDIMFCAAVNRQQ